MRYALLAMLLLGLAGCGGGAVAPPPQANGTKSNPTGGPGVVEQPGQSFANEFKAEYSKAKSAFSQFKKDQLPDSYARTGAHIYKALTYKIKHSRNKHDTNKLPNVTDLNVMFKDWKSEYGRLSTEGKKKFEDNAEYQAAFKEYQALGAE
ncbi:MAG: hypothetical protein KF696_14085 [Planctomycetes bacterium]|nr:hypothetical protein [Planctomycetota bacterium]MCW8136876.1 hypothetical protein [Planctomycetota bacterium]